MDYMAAYAGEDSTFADLEDLKNKAYTAKKAIYHSLLIISLLTLAMKS